MVQVGLHQGSVLSPLLFIIVLEALSREITSGCPEVLFHVEDLEFVSETLESLKGRLEALKVALKLEGLIVHTKKTKMMIISENTGKVTKKARVFFVACREVRGSNSIL